MNHKLFLLPLAILLIVSIESLAQTCSLPKPSYATISNIQSCTANLTWSAVTNAAYYKVAFKKQTSSEWSQKINVGSDTSFTFTELDGSTAYSFEVASYCANNKTAGFRTVNDSTATCTIPTVTKVEELSLTSVSISWKGCPSSFNKIRYKKSSSQVWTTYSTGTDQSVTLNDLFSEKLYVFQVNACSNSKGNWSPIDSFTLHDRPNILLIVLDDARFDTYSCNGAPSFFQTPNIDRIANEGINFKYSFCGESLCIPSRGTIVTGLYPHKHGATDNSSIIDSNLPTTAKILDSAGYYTAWIGKYHMAVSPQPGYDYWFATMVNSGTDEYHDMKYNYNGILKKIQGHDTDILTDTMLSFLDHHGTQKFFATLAYHAPHEPYIPQEAFDGIYNSEQMPVPEDTARFNQNYPSFVDYLSNNYYIAPENISEQYEKYFELIAGVDAGIGKILKKLNDLSILDSTMIIFTSDNGFILGEHGLFMKMLAYDASSRVPLFIRYPEWFADSTVVNDQMAENIDIAPTIIDAAGIHGNYSFDGIAVKNLANHSLNRTTFYYEYIWSDIIKFLPSIRAVRTLDKKLIKYGCNKTTEEFFDLSSDPHEDSNMIYDATYSEVIQNLTDQLNELHDQYKDIDEGTIRCLLLNKTENVYRLGIDAENVPDIEDNFLLYPNPAANELNVIFSSSLNMPEGSVLISDMLGVIQQSQQIEVIKGVNFAELKLDNHLTSGCYLLTVIAGDVREKKSFFVEK